MWFIESSKENQNKNSFNHLSPWTLLTYIFWSFLLILALVILFCFAAYFLFSFFFNPLFSLSSSLSSKIIVQIYYNYGLSFCPIPSILSSFLLFFFYPISLSVLGHSLDIPLILGLFSIFRFLSLIFPFLTVFISSMVTPLPSWRSEKCQCPQRRWTPTHTSLPPHTHTYTQRCMFIAQRQVCLGPACSLFTGTKETLGDKHHLWRHGGPSLRHRRVCVLVRVREERLSAPVRHSL